MQSRVRVSSNSKAAGLLQCAAQLFGRLQGDHLFRHSGHANRTRITSAVAGVDDDERTVGQTRRHLRTRDGCLVRFPDVVPGDFGRRLSVMRSCCLHRAVRSGGDVPRCRMVLRDFRGPRNTRMGMQECPKNDRQQKAAMNLDCYGLFRTPVPKPAHCELPRSAFAVYQANPVPGEMSGEAFMLTCVGLRTADQPLAMP